MSAIKVSDRTSFKVDIGLSNDDFIKNCKSVSIVFFIKGSQFKHVFMRSYPAVNFTDVSQKAFAHYIYQDFKQSLIT